MRTDVVLLAALAALFGAIAAVLALYQGYVEDNGSEPVDNLFEIAVFAALAAACGGLAWFCSRAPRSREQDSDGDQQ